LFAGPVIARSVVTAARRARLYYARTAYVAVLLVLTSTAWQLLTGTQVIRNLGDLARFGSLVFQIVAPLELVLGVFLAATSAALTVAQEKDRRTLALLLLTNLSNAELVLGELLAGLLNVVLLLVAAIPFFMLLALLGGISFDQIGRTLLVTFASALAVGSLGSTVAFWREKTFQTLAITALVLIFWTVGWEIVAREGLGATWAGVPGEIWAAGFSPWHAVLHAARPLVAGEPGLGWLRTPVGLYGLWAAIATVALNALAIARVRAWSTSGDDRPRLPRGETDASASTLATPSPRATTTGVAGGSRAVWDNPVLWREVRTWAYGRRVVAIRLAYVLLVVLAAVYMHSWGGEESILSRADAALRLVPLYVLSLLLVNAQAVTCITSERDARAIDLLLVTDLTPREFVFGKLAGVLYNAKEMVVLPMALAGFLAWQGALGLENLGYVLAGWMVMVLFSAVLGIHAGLAYGRSRTAIAVSLGTLFFLFIGVATCMRIIVAFSGSFAFQLAPFFAAMLGGFVGLYVALGARNPSPAITAAAFFCPLATLYALTSFLLGYTLAVFLVLVAAYGFTTAAMLVPALHEFEVAGAPGETTEET
jgi:ABC-type transport system involved in multi-copper enzyme maturation permease subunit